MGIQVLRIQILKQESHTFKPWLCHFLSLTRLTYSSVSLSVYKASIT